MPRPRDPVTDLPLPVAHLRLDLTPFHTAALFEMAKDGRACALSAARKLAIIDKAVDHVVDGDKPPKWIWETPDFHPKDRLLADLWQVAVREKDRLLADLWQVAVREVERVRQEAR